MLSVEENRPLTGGKLLHLKQLQMAHLTLHTLQKRQQL